MKAHERHREEAPTRLRIAVFTVSTSRYEKKMRGEDFVDESGEVAISKLRGLGHDVTYLGVVNDDVEMIRERLAGAIDAGFDAVVISGGTGIARRDVTVEAVRPLLEKEMEGVGEILRMESYKRIGAAAALTRAVAGVSNGRVIMALPGSPDAVSTALEIFGPELPHMVYIARGR